MLLTTQVSPKAFAIDQAQREQLIEPSSEIIRLPEYVAEGTNDDIRRNQRKLFEILEPLAANHTNLV